MRKVLGAPIRDLREKRIESAMTQAEFWSPLGVTQSAGSRSENGRTVPKPVALLIWFREQGRITAKDLEAGLSALTAK